MEVISEIASLPGTAHCQTGILGGVASGMLNTANSDTEVLYRYTSQILETRDVSSSVATLDTPETMATLHTHQLQLGCSEELEIAKVMSVILGNTIYMLIYAKDSVSRTGKLYGFNPYTLAIYHIAVDIPYDASLLSVSKPLQAGGGTSTEWEFSIVCFGLPKNRILLGNLTITSASAQLSALKLHNLDTLDRRNGEVVASSILLVTKGNGRALIFNGMSSGHVSVVEHSPFGMNCTRLLGTISEGAQLGAVVQLAAAISPTSDKNYVLCVGYNAPSCTSSSASVVTHVLEIESRSKFSTSLVQISRLEYPAGLDEDTSTGAVVGSYNREMMTQASHTIVDLQIHMVGNGSFRRLQEKVPSLFVTALSSPTTRSDSSEARALNEAYGLFNAWSIDEHVLKMGSLSQQVIPVPGSVLGMRLVGRAAHVEIITERHLLVGDHLLSATDVAFSNDERPELEVELGSFAYEPNVCSAITEQRRQMDGELFIELLLRMTGDDDIGTLYPPSDKLQQKLLIDRIQSSDLEDLKQHCLFYYLLLDARASDMVTAQGLYTKLSSDPLPIDGTGGLELASEYANATHIPRPFLYLMRGYWLMDHGQIEYSLTYLSDPTVVADWAPKILRIAVASECYSEAAQFLNSSTAVMEPKLIELPSECSIIMDVLLNVDLDRAFTFQRGRLQEPELRRALLMQLFVFAFTSKKTKKHRDVVDRLPTLPFDGVEESTLETYCLDTDSPVAARDFLALHYVNRGRYAEAIRLFKTISEGDKGQKLNKAQKRKRDERQTLVDNLVMLLPAAQRWLVDELDNSSQQPLSPHAKVGTDNGNNMDIEVTNESQEMGAQTPLSISRTTRCSLQPAVNSQGVVQSASHPLLKVLLKQMVPSLRSSLSGSHHGLATIKMSPNAEEDQPMSATIPQLQRETSPGAFSSETPYKTPISFTVAVPATAKNSPSVNEPQVTSPRVRAIVSPQPGFNRVPFSGYPSTPEHRNTTEDVKNICRSGNILSIDSLPKPKDVGVGLGSLDPSSVNRSPFEKIRQRQPIAKKVQGFSEEDAQQPTAKPKKTKTRKSRKGGGHPRPVTTNTLVKKI